MISEGIAHGYCMSRLSMFWRPYPAFLEFLTDQAICSEEKRGVLDGISVEIASSSARREGPQLPRSTRNLNRPPWASGGRSE